MLAIIYWPATLSVRSLAAVPWRNLFDSANIGPGNKIRQKFLKTFRWTTAINVFTVFPSSLDNLDLKGKLNNSTFLLMYATIIKISRDKKKNWVVEAWVIETRIVILYIPITNLEVGFRFFSFNVPYDAFKLTNVFQVHTMLTMIFFCTFFEVFSV